MTLFSLGVRARIYLLAAFIISFVSVGYCADDDGSRFQQSIEYYKRGNYDASAKVLSLLIQSNPKNALYWFNLGNCMFMTQNFERSSKYYQRAESLGGPLRPAAKLYRAKSLRKISDTEAASGILKELAAETLPQGIALEVRNEIAEMSGEQGSEDAALYQYQAGDFVSAEKSLKTKPEAELSVDARVLLGMTLSRQKKTLEAEQVYGRLQRQKLSAAARITVQELLKQLRRNEFKIRPYWLTTDLSVGNTDNAYLDGKTTQLQSSVLLRAQLSSGYHFHEKDDWSEKISYVLNYDSPQSAPELKSVVHTVRGSGIGKLGSLDISAGPYVQLQSWNNVSVSHKVGLNCKATYGNTAWQGGVDADLVMQKADDGAYNYLSGNSAVLRPFLGFWKERFYGEFYWTAGSDGTQDIVYSDGARLPLKHSYAGPGVRILWQSGLQSYVFAEFATLAREFTEPALPGPKIRKDQELSLSVKYAFVWSPQSTIYTMAEGTRNGSTLTQADVRDKNFDVLIVSLGLNWEIF